MHDSGQIIKINRIRNEKENYRRFSSTGV